MLIDYGTLDSGTRRRTHFDRYICMFEILHTCTSKPANGKFAEQRERVLLSGSYHARLADSFFSRAIGYFLAWLAPYFLSLPNKPFLLESAEFGRSPDPAWPMLMPMMDRCGKSYARGGVPAGLYLVESHVPWQESIESFVPWREADANFTGPLASAMSSTSLMVNLTAFAT